MLRKSVFLALVVALAAGSMAQAAVIGSATLKGNPPGVAFTSPDAALGSPWVSYALDLSTTAGELIGGIDVSITGQLHQRWTFDEDQGVFVPTGNSANMTNGDSHLRAVTGALFGAGPTEDNPGTGSPLPDTATSDYGVGTSLSGAWGITAAASTASLAYIVVPATSLTTPGQFAISVSVANPAGDIIGTLDRSAFAGLPSAGGGTVTVGDLNLASLAAGDTVNGNVAIENVNTLAFNNIAAPVFTPLIAGQTLNLVSQPTLNNTGAFSWNTDGAKRGTYAWAITGTGAGGATDGGTITVTVPFVPEPGTLVLFGLAFAGVAGVARRRS